LTKDDAKTAGEPVSAAAPPPPTIHVLLADDHPIARAGARALLTQEGIEVVGEAATGEQAVEMAAALLPDVVLMDVSMPGMDGIAATEEIRRTLPDIYIIMFSTFDTRDWVVRSIAAGASGYLLKGVSRQALTQAVELVKHGGSLVDSRVLSALASREGEGEDEGLESLTKLLSPRELQVLHLVASGLTNKEIAVRIDYSVGTVKNVVQRIIEKLDVPDRTAAAVLAVRSGLV